MQVRVLPSPPRGRCSSVGRAGIKCLGTLKLIDRYSKTKLFSSKPLSSLKTFQTLTATLDGYINKQSLGTKKLKVGVSNLLKLSLITAYPSGRRDFYYDT